MKRKNIGVILLLVICVVLGSLIISSINDKDKELVGNEKNDQENALINPDEMAGNIENNDDELQENSIENISFDEVDTDDETSDLGNDQNKDINQLDNNKQEDNKNVTEPQSEQTNDDINDEVQIVPDSENPFINAGNQGETEEIDGSDLGEGEWGSGDKF